MGRRYYVDDGGERIHVIFKELPPIQPPFDRYRLPEILVAGNRATRRRFPHPLEVIASDTLAKRGAPQKNDSGTIAEGSSTHVDSGIVAREVGTQEIFFEDVDGVYYPLTVKPDENLTAKLPTPWSRMVGFVRRVSRKMPKPAFTGWKRELTEDETELLNSIKNSFGIRELRMWLEYDYEKFGID